MQAAAQSAAEVLAAVAAYKDRKATTDVDADPNSKKTDSGTAQAGLAAKTRFEKKPEKIKKGFEVYIPSVKRTGVSRLQEKDLEELTPPMRSVFDRADRLRSSETPDGGEIR